MKKFVFFVVLAILILVIGSYILNSNKKIPDEPTELSITYLGEPIIQKTSLVCWKDCEGISESEVLSLNSTEFEDFKPNTIPYNSKFELSFNGIHPDEIGYIASTTDNEDNGAKVFSTLLEPGTTSFIIPPPIGSEQGDFKFIAKWYEKKKLKGQIEIMFKVKYKQN